MPLQQGKIYKTNKARRNVFDFMARSYHAVTIQMTVGVATVLTWTASSAVQV
jgi:hypothetical protein